MPAPLPVHFRERRLGRLVVRQRARIAAALVGRGEDLAQVDYHKIQKALEIYVNYFKNAEQVPAKPACDERVFKLFDAHVDFLRNMGFGGDASTASVHFSICCDTLQPLAHSE